MDGKCLENVRRYRSSAILAWLRSQVKTRSLSKMQNAGSSYKEKQRRVGFRLFRVIIKVLSGFLRKIWEMIGWENTRSALGKLEELLTCKVWYVFLGAPRLSSAIPSLHVLCLFHFYLSISANLVSDPCSLEACDHIFCRYVCEWLYFMSGELCQGYLEHKCTKQLNQL